MIMVTRAQTVIDNMLELMDRYPDKSFEITATGEIIEVSPKFTHSEIQARLAYLLVAYLNSGKLPAHTVLTECAHDLKGWPCRPDVSINPRGDEEIPTVAPLLAVEIKSDSNSLKDLRTKARKYLEAGTALVWLVLPEKRLIEVYQAAADDQVLTEADTLEHLPALPELNLPVRAVFGNERRSP